MFALLEVPRAPLAKSRSSIREVRGLELVYFRELGRGPDRYLSTASTADIQDAKVIEAWRISCIPLSHGQVSFPRDREQRDAHGKLQACSGKRRRRSRRAGGNKTE